MPHKLEFFLFKDHSFLDVGNLYCKGHGEKKLTQNVGMFIWRIDLYIGRYISLQGGSLQFVKFPLF